MKKLFLIILAAVAVSALGIFAQQPSQPGTSATSAAKRAPQAKTQAEYKDYNTAYAITGGAAMEKAADDFAAKYPKSELRPYLYSKVMHEYQNENKPDRMLAMGEKVLALDPDNPIALVLTATVLSDSLNDSDANREQKIAETRKNATRALQTIDSGFAPPANASPEQVAAYKTMLRSMAHSALGIVNLKIGDDAGAENELKAAAELNKTQPDPYIWYHLALAQDHQTKYPEALASVNEALRYSGSNPELDKLAHGERDRLMKLTGATQTQPNSSQPPQ
jgi:tetratricopeptide (TPR) repeat protein